jgi:hypothetical protein
MGRTSQTTARVEVRIGDAELSVLRADGANTRPGTLREDIRRLAGGLHTLGDGLCLRKEIKPHQVLSAKP